MKKLSVYLGKALRIIAEDGDRKALEIPLRSAFDGSGLECGVHEGTGAIHFVDFDGEHILYRVNGDGEACGISACGAVTAVSALKSRGILDPDGFMTDRDLFTIGEGVALTPADIRAVQYDKAVTRAALELFAEFDGVVRFFGEPFALPEGFEALIEIGAIPEHFQHADFSESFQCIDFFMLDKFPLEFTAQIERDYLNYLIF